MAEITTAMVKQLRDRTGQSIGDCRNALKDTDGDMEQAVDLLRKKGMAVLDKRSERETREGKIVNRMSEDGKSAVLTSLCCETDFTSKNDLFQAAAETLADALLQAESIPESTEALEQLTDSNGKKVADATHEIVGTTGEKTTVGSFARFDLAGPGLLHCYVHFNGKIGTLVQIDAESDQVAGHEAVKTLASDLAMHITAINPVAVDRDQIDPELIEREKEVARSQVEGKPDNIIDKIVTGKINKWFQQVVLLEQPFVKDDSKTVADLVKETGKTAGGPLTVRRFKRLQIG